MPLEPGMYERGNPTVDKIFTYTLDAHGGIMPRTNMSPPAGLQLIFYSNASYVLCLPAPVKTQICASPVSHINDIKEMVENPGQAAIGLATPNRTRAGPGRDQIQYSYTCEDYMYTPDDDGAFKSGVTDCTSKNIIINIDRDHRGGITLQDICRLVRHNHIHTYGDVGLIQLHILTCRASNRRNSSGKIPDRGRSLYQFAKGNSAGGEGDYGEFEPGDHNCGNVRKICKRDRQARDVHCDLCLRDIDQTPGNIWFHCAKHNYDECIRCNNGSKTDWKDATGGIGCEGGGGAGGAGGAGGGGGGGGAAGPGGGGGGAAGPRRDTCGNVDKYCRAKVPYGQYCDQCRKNASDIPETYWFRCINHKYDECQGCNEKLGRLGGKDKTWPGCGGWPAAGPADTAGGPGGGATGWGGNGFRSGFTFNGGSTKKNRKIKKVKNRKSRRN